MNLRPKSNVNQGHVHNAKRRFFVPVLLPPVRVSDISNVKTFLRLFNDRASFNSSTAVEPDAIARNSVP